MHIFRTFLLGILLVSATPAVAATSRSLSSSSSQSSVFGVRFEQDGKIIEPRNHSVVLKKAPFKLIFDLESTSNTIQLNASLANKTSRVLMRNAPLSKLESVFGAGTGYAEEYYDDTNMPHELYVANDGSHYWSYEMLQRGEEHRYESVKRADDVIQAVRAVDKITVLNRSSGKSVSTPIAEMKQRVLNLSIILGVPNGAPDYDTHELGRDYVKVRFR